MPQHLSDIELDEVTVCEEPANDDCVAVIVKAKSGSDAPLTETDMPQVDQNLDDELEAGAEGEGDFEFTQEDYDAAAAEIEELNESGDLVPAFLALAAGAEMAGETITKMAAALEQADAMAEDFEELKKSTKLLVEKVAKQGLAGAKEDETDDLVSSIRKSLGGAELPPDVEARISAVEAVNKANEDKEAITKARELGVGKPDELAPVLQRVLKGKTTAKDHEYLTGLLKQLGATIKKSKAFESIGADNGASADSAQARLNAAVTDIRKSNPTLTKQQATDRALEEDPQLYTDYLSERQQRLSA